MTRNSGIMMKSSLLGIFAAAVMAFVMVAIATQTSFAEPSWRVTNNGQEYVLKDGKVTLSVAHNYTGGETISYQWYDEYGNEIVGATSQSYIATKVGRYGCRVSIAEEILWADYYVEYSWKITNNYEYYVLTDGKVTITVAHNYTGGETISYQWYYESKEESDAIIGATSQSYIATKAGWYGCRVSIAGKTLWASHSVGYSWWIENDGEEYVITDGKAILSVETDYTGSETVSYQWYDGDDNEIVGATSQSYIATKAGWYRCRVSIAGDTQRAGYYVGYSWWIENDGEEYVFTDGKATMTVDHNYTGDEIVKYQWYQWDNNSGNYIKINGAVGKTYITGELGYYRCEVNIGGEILDACYNVFEDEYYSVWIGDLPYALNTKIEADQAGVWGYRGTPSGSISIQDRVTLSNGKTYTVTKLGGLYGMENVTQMSIPATVTDIEEKSIGYYGYNDYEDELYIKVPGFTIIGKTGSAAHQYALDNGFNFKELDNQGEQGSGQGSGNGDTNTDPNTNTPVVNNPVTQPESIKTVTVNSNTVNASSIRKAITEAGGSPEHIKTFVIGKNVKKISKKAFAGFGNITTLELRTKKLKAKSVKGALKGSNIKTVKVKVGKKKENKKFVKSYKKIFTKKNAGKKVKIK